MLLKILLTTIAVLASSAQALASDAHTLSEFIRDPVFGENFGQSLSPRQKELQELWWSYLQKETGMDQDRLSQRLGSGKYPYFDGSCRRAAAVDAADVAKLQSSLAGILLSGVPGHPAGGTPGGRGRYLACLSNSGLNVLKTMIEIRIQAVLRGDEGGFRCQFQDMGENLVTAAYVSPANKMITWHMRSSWPRRAAGIERYWLNGSWSEMTFGNVLFHELIHVGGGQQELLAYTATSCCGDEVHDRAGACAGLDAMAQRAPNISGLAKPLATFQLFMQQPFQLRQYDAESLAYLFYDRLAQAMPALATEHKRAECIKASGRASCVRQARGALQATLVDITKPGGQCEAVLSGDGADKVCMGFKPDYKNTIELMLEMLF